ncbi:Cof-type HAD-IIB family hydrolase [Listeria sp. PSOL-1]|uniref:Cof-type HAD-IIB family hydrolase n=1 Tax=Listeria sp. PSOL-1 TaxID=1844999 RepID=UPI0013D2A4A3|nr:Cof-type HAD-IIB family hydrolase [Listeria sp. PSOL-1]
MDKKLIVLDLDGTALKENQTISIRTQETLKKARLSGHEVMIATGRPYRLSSQYYQALNLTTPIVNFNGAVLHHPHDKHYKENYHHAIDLAIVRELLDFTTQFPLSNIAAEVEDNVFLKEKNDSIPATFHAGVNKIFIGDLRKNIQADATSLLFFGKEKELSLISNHLDQSLSHVISYHTWGASWPAVEVVKHGIHKAIGIRVAAKTLGIHQRDIIAFGDENNDLQMLDYAGIGVAMGNATPEAKSIANEITLSNEEDGIAVYLEERLHL